MKTSTTFQPVTVTTPHLQRYRCSAIDSKAIEALMKTGVSFLDAIPLTHTGWITVAATSRAKAEKAAAQHFGVSIDDVVARLILPPRRAV